MRICTKLSLHKGGQPIYFFVLKETRDALLESQRKRHAELIHQLKGQLQELESYAYESGEGSMPSNVLLERQRVVMGKKKYQLFHARSRI